MLNLDSVEFKNILGLVYKLTGITLGESKKILVQGRLRPRLKKLGLDTYQNYFLFLKENKEEQQEFINLITTNETSFFRTTRVWDYFREEFLKNWDKGNTLNMWSAASSTGEEAYSLAMSCEEETLRNYQIYASDISSKVIKIAEQGEYQGRNIEAFKQNYAEFYRKYFSEDRVSEKLKSKIMFSTHNLFNPPFKKDFFDIVFLRNVLIYFESKDQEKVLENIYASLRKEGVLVIGESESLNSLKTNFTYIKPLIYIKK